MPRSIHSAFTTHAASHDPDESVDETPDDFDLDEDFKPLDDSDLEIDDEPDPDDGDFWLDPDDDEDPWN